MADQITNLTALTWSAIVIALVWIFLCVAGAAGVVLYRRGKIMFSCGYGWRDSGVLLRRRSKRALHARLNADRPQTVTVRPGEVYTVGEGVTSAAFTLDASDEPAHAGHHHVGPPPGGHSGPGYTEAIEVINGVVSSISYGAGGAGTLADTITAEVVKDDGPAAG